MKKNKISDLIIVNIKLMSSICVQSPYIELKYIIKYRKINKCNNKKIALNILFIDMLS